MSNSFRARAAIVLLTAIGYFFVVLTFNLLEEIEQLKEDCEPDPVPAAQHGPDIRHCFLPEETRELWDCIRNEKSDDSDSRTRGVSTVNHEVGHLDGNARSKAQVRKDF
jgi:hypothetical protein